MNGHSGILCRHEGHYHTSWVEFRFWDWKGKKMNVGVDGLVLRGNDAQIKNIFILIYVILGL